MLFLLLLITSWLIPSRVVHWLGEHHIWAEAGCGLSMLADSLSKVSNANPMPN